jgi:hypothetical protein
MIPTLPLTQLQHNRLQYKAFLFIYFFWIEGSCVGVVLMVVQESFLGPNIIFFLFFL